MAYTRCEFFHHSGGSLVFSKVRAYERRTNQMLDRSVAENRAKQSLVGFPPQVVDAYLKFAGGDMNALDTVVLGVLHFYLASKPSRDLAEMPGTTRLIDDLGCDSLTMMDMVFMVESLFDIKIDDAELVQIVTLDDLRRKLHEHVRAAGATLG